jgi:hypothetical protein
MNRDFTESRPILGPPGGGLNLLVAAGSGAPDQGPCVKPPAGPPNSFA